MSETSSDHNFYNCQQTIHLDNFNIKSHSHKDEIYLYNNPEKESKNIILENRRSESTNTKSLTGNYQLKRSPDIPENEEYNVLKSNLHEMESELLKMKFNSDLKANNTNLDQSNTQGLNFLSTERINLITAHSKSNKINDKKNTFSSVTSSSNFFIIKVTLIKFKQLKRK